MKYLTARETAEKWNISIRMVQQFCTAGRIPGAQKFGKSWAIPADAEKPVDPHRTRQQRTFPTAQMTPAGLLDHTSLMPLMNTAFAPGHCREAVEAMAEGPQRDIATAEYYYFTGQPERAAAVAETYLTSADTGARLSACLLYAYANLSIGQIQHARFALGELKTAFAGAGEQVPQFKAAAAFVVSAGAVLLHLPMPEKLPEDESFLPMLPVGLRAFAVYVQAHYLYLKGEYGTSAGIVEGALAMGGASYPIPAIYLRLVAVMDYVSLKQIKRAQSHLLSAWALAQPDDLIEGFGEHHGLLGATLEAVIKPKWPEEFRRIIDITYRFFAGWRKVHNPLAGHDVADDLTTTEFAVAMLAARDWTTREIAEHMGISVNTVKSHISEAMGKLNVDNRKDLKQYMLR